MATEEDSSLVYIVLVVCVLAILAFFVYKLYARINEISEKLEGLKNELITQDSEDFPSIEEVSKEDPKENIPVEEPNTSKEHSKKKN
tara:strand:- start:4068 stop:4328 length:261 start_codon:yes stop_codon:yes gene_type:complete